jgi:class 3 adenylate cyclase
VAVRLQVRGGASGLTFDDQTFKAVAGEAAWKTPGFEDAPDRYEVLFSGGVRGLVVDNVEPRPAGRARRRLATVLFTDIVGSTQRAQAAGDERWRELLDAHDEAARRLVDAEGGRLVKRTGARSWCPGPSGTWWPAPASPSRTAGPTPSRA